MGRKMTAEETELFVSLARGASLRLGFEALLLALAKAKGEEAAEWLCRFEAQVAQDVGRMSAGGEIPPEVMRQAVGEISSDFSTVFRSVRERISDA